MGNYPDWLRINLNYHDCTLLDSLDYMEMVDLNNQMISLDVAEIYRFKTEPYECLMKHTKIFLPEDVKCNHYIEAIKAVSHLVHKSIAKIHNIYVAVQNSICLKHTTVETYSSYYALNLQQVIDQRKKDDVRFTAGQLWYILNSLLDLSATLEKLKLFFGVYTPRNIYITSEGYLKVYLYHLSPNHKHFLYFHALINGKSLVKYLPLPPECLPSLQSQCYQLDPHMSLPAMDAFGIGMVVLEAMLFNSVRKYYQSEGGSSRISFHSHQLRTDIQELKTIYPSTLINLVESITREDPTQRMDFKTARAYVQSVREEISMSGAVRIYEDEDNKIVPKVSYRSVREEDQHSNVLRSISDNGIQAKLSVGPISYLSKPQSREKPIRRVHANGLSLVTARNSIEKFSSVGSSSIDSRIGSRINARSLHLR